jgi:hypothetical protein
MDTVLIDTGYTYYFAADSGIYAIVQNGVTVTDTARDKIIYFDSKTGRDTFQLATWFYDWEYEDDLDSVTLPEDSLLLLVPGSANGSGGEESYMQFLPSLDTKMTHAHLSYRIHDTGVRCVLQILRRVYGETPEVINTHGPLAEPNGRCSTRAQYFTLLPAPRAASGTRPRSR